MSGTAAIPHGAWPSPLSAAVVAAGAVRLGGPVQRGDEVWWSELRPSEAGRSVLVRRVADGDPVDVLAPPYSARSRVHEYGGGAWWLGPDDDVYFANWLDQRLYRHRIGPDAGGSQPEPLTPEPPSPGAWRYADGRVHPGEPWVMCVRERHVEGLGGQPVGGPTRGHSGPSPRYEANTEPRAGADPLSPSEAVNELVAVAIDGSEPEPRIVGTGIGDSPQADFVAAPRFSPDGRWLSWVRWNHPNMPWDGTELCVAPVFGGMRLGNTQIVAGGTSEAIHGADWTSDGRLVFSTDRSGWWNLHHWTPGGGRDQALTALNDAEIGGPSWAFGTQHWTELSDGRLAVVVTRDASDAIAIVEADGSVTDLDTPFVAVDALCATDRDTLLVNAATPTALPALIELAVDGRPVAVHRASDDIGVDPAWFSVARPLRYESSGRLAHAFVYPPTGVGVAGPGGERPPLVVMGHGGPTGHSSPALNLRVQYWTSRGFAVADVNYGGSSGFGRDYRRLLTGTWGVVDVEDCIAVAEAMAAEGLVDRERMAIRGGSAGGFTVLKALIDSEVFSAGTSLYGVADLEALATDTHKFESRYLDGLIGPYPAQRARYVERSPISHVEGFSCPLLVLQGLEDEIVPPNQSEAIVSALAAKGIPHAYVAFEGEQHGFRQEVNIIRSYEVELWFYGRVFGFEPADPIEAPPGAVGL